MTMLGHLGLLLMLPAFLSVSAIGTNASPLARIHVKFVQPPHVQEHGITTDGGRLITQESYLSIGRRNAPSNLRIDNSFRGTDNSFSGIDYYPRSSSPTRYATQRRTFAPVEQNDIHYGTREYNHPTPDFSNGLDYPDPLLLTGEAAMLAVKYIYGRGELFFHDIPHVRAVLRNQEERRQNGLNGNILSSLRPNSPWYRRDD